MHSLHLKKKVLPAVSAAEPTDGFMYGILLVTFRSQEYMDPRRTVTMYYLSCFPCGLFGYDSACTIKEPSKSHLVTVPSFLSLSNKS